MSKLQIYDINYTSPTSIPDEDYKDLGSGVNKLGVIQRAFKGSTDFVVRTASGGGGTLLVENTDYTLVLDAIKTTAAGFNVYSGFIITNVTYQTGTLYFTYKTVGSYTSADWANTVQESSSGYYRQLLLNSNFDVWQQRTSTSSSGQYAADQYQHSFTATSVTWQQSTTPIFTNQGEYTSQIDMVADSGELWELIHYVPAYRSTKYFGKKAQFNIELKQQSITAGSLTLQVFVQVPSVKNDWTTVETLASSDTITLDGNIQNIPFEFDLSQTTGSGYDVRNGCTFLIRIIQNSATGTSVFYINNIQVNEGNILLPFQPMDDLAELLTFFRQADGTEDSAELILNGSQQTATLFQGVKTFDPPMFKAPSISISTVGHFRVVSGGVALTVSSVVISGPTKKSGRIDVVTSAGNIGYGSFLQLQDVLGFLTFDARLN